MQAEPAALGLGLAVAKASAPLEEILAGSRSIPDLQSCPRTGVQVLSRFYVVSTSRSLLRESQNIQSCKGPTRIMEIHFLLQKTLLEMENFFLVSPANL